MEVSFGIYDLPLLFKLVVHRPRGTVQLLVTFLTRIRSVPQEYTQTELPRLVADQSTSCTCMDDGCILREAQTLELLS
jgi:hypothetical protein